ncbi:expressed unknown protein [Seminavis robusta]|nr:expressed unknown protein [Seminavis robusta]|eukprot:Sro1515_g278950.1 n/a (97) ;mRNA; f:887-1177
METEEPEKAASSSQATAETETKHRRRRKKMVEQTFTDENGYIYTETKAVWEDVPSDEEEQFPVPSKKIVQAKGKKPIKKPSKQGSITSFFGKPKKK